MKTCNKCCDSKHFNFFHKNRNGRNGYADECKKCVSERKKLRRVNGQHVLTSAEWGEKQKENGAVVKANIKLDEERGIREKGMGQARFKESARNQVFKFNYDSYMSSFRL